MLIGPLLALTVSTEPSGTISPWALRTFMFEKLELTWDEFCKEYAGISRENADRIIRQHEEFGEAYFRLSEIARISPETYRQIASQVSEEGLEFDGRKLALIPENGPKIRAAIQTLRAQLQEVRDANQPASPGIIGRK